MLDSAPRIMCKDSQLELKIDTGREEELEGLAKCSSLSKSFGDDCSFLVLVFVYLGRVALVHADLRFLLNQTAETLFNPCFQLSVFSHRCVATFMARMGQCFSTSMDAVGIDVNEGTSWDMDEDIETPDGSYCFSDGVGRISDSLGRQVRNQA